MTSEELIEKSLALPDIELAIAYRILFGENWKRYTWDRHKAEEMRSILSSGTMPCVEFNRWVDLINYLTETVAVVITDRAVNTNLTLDEAKAAYISGKKIRHSSFFDDEFVVQDRFNDMIDENGIRISKEHFWSRRTAGRWLSSWSIID